MPRSSSKVTSLPRHRSHNGCWTCKRKRVQCDEIRPACERCSSRGLVCEGYEVRLRWGSGIASRGRYTGAEKPVKEAIPPRSTRRWNLRMKEEKPCHGNQQGKPVVFVRAESTLVPLPKPVEPRATVNILNPSEQPSQIDNVLIQHFEIPSSMDHRRNIHDTGEQSLRQLRTLETCPEAGNNNLNGDFMVHFSDGIIRAG